MLVKRIIKYFTFSKPHLARLLQKSPKVVENDSSTGLLARIFQQSKKTPTYLMQKQLFVYLQQSKQLEEQFPFLKSDSRFEQNWMVLHLQILKARLEKLRSEAINEQQLQKFNYNAQVYFFPAYAKYLNPQTPAMNYAVHYAEAFLKRYLIFEEHFNEHYQARPNEEALNGLLRKLVYENRFGTKDGQLIKLVKYYTAHRKYLKMLEWNDLVSHRVKWGFETQRVLLEQLGK